MSAPFSSLVKASHLLLVGAPPLAGAPPSTGCPGAAGALLPPVAGLLGAPAAVAVLAAGFVHA
jgi:hypothetical protein